MIFLHWSCWKLHQQVYIYTQAQIRLCAHTVSDRSVITLHSVRPVNDYFTYVCSALSLSLSIYICMYRSSEGLPTSARGELRWFARPRHPGVGWAAPRALSDSNRSRIGLPPFSRATGFRMAFDAELDGLDGFGLVYSWFRVGSGGVVIWIFNPWGKCVCFPKMLISDWYLYQPYRCGSNFLYCSQ